MAIFDELVQAPAKLNLYLRVCGRRDDGYHLIDSLMVPVSLYDELRIAVRSVAQATSPSVITLWTDCTYLPTGADNLAYRAAAEFTTVTRQSMTVDIRIYKHIPLGSGLGGGSSDAAAVLLTLNRWLGNRLSTRQLADAGARIGADVPFFVYGRPARVGGVGEQIKPTTLGRCLDLVICSDGHPLSTALVYSQMRAMPLSLTRDGAVSNIAAFVEGRKPLTDLLVNDLEEAAVQIHPELRSLKAKVMEAGAQAALMSGSGSAVFGVWDDAQSAAAGAARLQRLGLWAKPVQTLELSPALGN
ncbi:MAG TPA: 4-(cytidine 5'-diphospho)-2-C-methyl-D-erythritol kinase [Candidatus Margulisiibacteriota bacterium]|nr:4-(cytidine 5'-diphospho)-2-C-methyl-D-erythritol kinase [Candidatus Margulisiibacteriota bacterium]